MFHPRTFLLGLAVCSAAALPAKDIHRAVFTTQPTMHCHKCEVKIKNQLKFEKGIKSIDVDVPAQSITVTYDAEKTTASKLAESLSKLKYNVRVVSDEKTEGEKEKKEESIGKKK